MLVAGLQSMKIPEQIQGFLIYVAQMYEWTTPYLKGLHLTIDLWQPNRDAETGWGLKHLKRDKDGDWVLVLGDEVSPKSINPKGELREMLTMNIQSLRDLFTGETMATCVYKGI